MSFIHLDEDLFPINIEEAFVPKGSIIWGSTSGSREPEGIQKEEEDKKPRSYPSKNLWQIQIIQKKGKITEKHNQGANIIPYTFTQAVIVVGCKV